MFSRSILLAAVLAPLTLSSALAQTVNATVSGYTAIGIGAISDSERVPITVTRNDGPLHAEASGEGGRFFSQPIGDLPGYFTSASATGFAAADPGVLHVYGSDLAIARPAIIGPNLPGAVNPNTVYTAIQATASFTDSLTVNAPGRPPGAPVQLEFNFLAEVVTDTALGYPQWSAHPISVSASFIIPGYGPQNFSTETNLFMFGHTPLGNGNELYSVGGAAPFLAHVGEVWPISAGFSIFGQANVTPTDFPPQFGGFADGRNTAGIWLGHLPDGVVVTSASGHDYTIDPTAPALVLPEPQSYALIFAGLGLIGFVARRHRSSASRR